MARTFLIRHGKPAAAWGGGDADPGLDIEGEAQAEFAARTLLNLPASERPVSVASSPLRRCLETARPLADALGVRLEIVPEVGEIPTPRSLEPAARGAWLRQAFLGQWSAIEGDLDYEVWRQDVLAAVAARPGSAVFSHFVAINGAVSLLENTDQVIVFRPAHASITTLEVTDHRPRLVKLGTEAATGVL